MGKTQHQRSGGQRLTIAALLAGGILGGVFLLVRSDPIDPSSPRPRGESPAPDSTNPDSTNPHSIDPEHGAREERSSLAEVPFGPPPPPTPEAHPPLVGHVFDHSGAPVPHALVRLHEGQKRLRHPLADPETRPALDEGQPLASVQSDANGRFEIAIVDTMPPYVAPDLRFVAGDHSEPLGEHGSIRGPEPIRLRWGGPRLLETSSLAENAPSEAGVSPTFLRAHAVRFEVWHPDHRLHRSEPWQIDPDDLPTIEIHLAAGRVLAGTIVDTRGRSRSDVEVRARRGTSIAIARTDERGHFRLSGISDGLHTIDLPDPAWQLRDRPTVPAEGSHTLKIVAIPPGSIFVQVLEKGSGRPSPVAELQLERSVEQVGTFSGGVSEPTVLAEANREISLAAGRWKVTANTPGGGMATGSVEVASDTLEQVTLWVGRRGSIAGRAVDDRGYPIRGVTIGLARLDEKKRGTTTAVVTQRDGRFSLEGIEPGRYSVVARHPDHPELTPPPFTIDDGEQVDFGDLQLETGVRLAGRLSLDRGGSPQWVEVSVELCEARDGPCARAGVRPAVDLDRGRWSVTGLPEGEVRVAVRYIPEDPAANGAVLTWESEVFTLRHGESPDLDIFLPRHGQ